ncbi:hypothetical protein [Streptomyces sp. NBC_00989]|uniref:hypothetical protein n=1 Tax=Streptomyces sp. NBC_00989 TaxID=2903705 RepID=UPI00386E60A1|nr:hypothetical protein OG714_41035 [Streptomyces sp. NBC_00989]
MSRALPKYNKRRVVFIGGAAAVALTGAVIAGTALAGTPDKSSTAQSAQTLSDPGTIACPDVKSQLPAVPASAQAEVDRNLTLLDTQIAEANKRLVDTVGQGGANFVQNAILGPLKDKRVSTIERIAISIGRQGTKPTGLDALAACTLNTGGTEAGGTETGTETGSTDTATPSATAAATEAAGGTEDTGDASSAVGTISCPDVKSQLPAVPASAQAEVDRNLTLLDTQITEANKRLVDTVGQGGANFVQNAILGPLADKRVSTIERIAISIGRQGTKPSGLDSLAACTLTK